MTIIVTDTGFGVDTLNLPWVPFDQANLTAALDLGSDTNLDDLNVDLSKVQAIRIDFPSFADGRGFTLARLLRLRGFQGHLRAKGHIISDQYAMARRSGFDDVEITNAQAQRQPQSEWVFRANWHEHDYQTRLRKSA
jgi:uncharacterized protein (DUF934 family)